MLIRAIIVDFYDVLYGQKDTTQLCAFEQSHDLPAGGLRQAMSQARHFHTPRLGKVSGEMLWRDVAKRIGASQEEGRNLQAA